YDITWRDVLGRTGDEGSRMKDPTYGRPLRQRNDILGNMSLKFGGSRCACAHGYYLVVNAVRLSSGHPFHPGILFIWTSLSSGRAFHPGVPFIQASLSSGRPFHPGIINTTALPEVAFTEDTTPDFIIVVDNTYVLKVKILIRVGTSINSFLWSEGKVPIVYGNEVTNNCSESDAGSCYLSCLEESRIHGKVVMCVFYAGIEAVKVAGALGTSHPILEIMNPEAKILKSEAIKNPDAPFVASDSSRGPSMYFPDLIKKNHKAVLGRMERVLQLQRKVPKIVAHLLFGDVVTVTGFNTFVISFCTPHALSEMRVDDDQFGDVKVIEGEEGGYSTVFAGRLNRTTNDDTLRKVGLFSYIAFYCMWLWVLTTEVPTFRHCDECKETKLVSPKRNGGGVSCQDCSKQAKKESRQERQLYLTDEQNDQNHWRVGMSEDVNIHKFFDEAMVVELAQHAAAYGRGARFGRAPKDLTGLSLISQSSRKALRAPCFCLAKANLHGTPRGGFVTMERYKVISDSEDSTVTYTILSSLFGGSSDIGSLGVDGPPVMPEDPYAYVVAAFPAPPSPDYVPGLEYPPLPDFVPEPVYPEFMPLEDEVLPAEEQPLPAAALPTTDSPDYVSKSDPEENPEEDDDEDPEEDTADYPADGGDDGDDEDESSDDDEDDDVDIQENEDVDIQDEHPAPVDSIAIALLAVDQAPSAEETEPFETDESAATPPPHPAY
ncbi:hypothetical protein Tco_0641028, partial [Tanacetum coccineum]